MKAIQADEVEAQSIKTQSLRVGQVLLTSQKIQLAENTLLQVGDNAPVQMKDLLQMAEYTRKLIEKCGA